MPIQQRLRAGAFSAEELRAICDAFDRAWASLQASDRHPTGPEAEMSARDMLAKRIIDEAKAGILDVTALEDDALAYLRETLPAAKPDGNPQT
jgi:hypothetical protein